MSAATSLWGGLVRSATLRAALVLLGGMLLAGPGARPAQAGALYRCHGRAGETVFSGSTEGYADCRRISVAGLAAPGRARRTPAPASKASLAGVRATVETKAVRLPASAAAPAVSLAGVRASVEATTGRLLPSAAPAASLAGVRASVESSAGWNYREGGGPASQDQAALATVAVAKPRDPVLRGAVYRIVRADGSVEYTNIPPAGHRGRVVTVLFSYIATCVACNLRSPIRWDSIALNLDAYADIIRAASLESGVNEALLRAVIHAESAFNPRALSLKGAQGLMQLMPATASEVGVRDPFDVEQNIRGGARYLGYLLKSFNGDERLATAAYNAGEATVQRYRGVPPFAETLVYVQRVGVLYARYRQGQARALGAL